MQTRTYGELIDLIQSLIGAGTMLGDEYLKLSNFINRRYSQAYNTSPSWSRYIVPSEKRNIVNLNFSGGDGPNEDNVYINQDYKFIGLNSGTGDATANLPVYQGVTTPDAVIYRYESGGTKRWYVVTDVTVTIESDKKVTVGSYDAPGDLEFFETATDGEESVFDVAAFSANSFTQQTGTAVIKRINVIPYAQLGTNTIGEFIRVHRKEAFERNSAIEYDFFVNEQGAHLLNTVDTNATSAFVTYKIPLTLFTVAVSDPPVAADFIDGGTPNGAANRALEVPLEFFDYLAHASFADFLRLESKYEDARVEEAIAQNYLNIELEKIDIRNNNNSINQKFSTYVNRQSR